MSKTQTQALTTFNLPQLFYSIESSLTKKLHLSRIKNQIIGTGYITGLKTVSNFLNIPKPTVFMSKNSSITLCESISQFGLKKILIVTDQGLYDLGILSEILKTLEKLNMPYSLFTEVEPDPTFSLVEKGIEQYKKDECDSVLAIGGGSSIDAAKVIALASANNVSATSLIGLFKGKKPAAPFFTIPTTSGTGSEATIGAVISDSETHKKELIIDTKLVPLIAALDPELMKGLPAFITAATGIDALTHLIEAYLSGMANEESDYYARSGIQLIFENLPLVLKKGNNLKAREKMALASYYGGLTINIAGLGYVHAFAHQLGAKYRIPHGLANAKVLPHVLEFNKPFEIERMAEIARFLGLEKDGDTSETLADKFIHSTKELISNAGIDFIASEIKEEDIDGIIQEAFKETNSTYAVSKYMSYDEARALLVSLSGKF